MVAEYRKREPDAGIIFDSLLPVYIPIQKPGLTGDRLFNLLLKTKLLVLEGDFASAGKILNSAKITAATSGLDQLVSRINEEEKILRIKLNRFSELIEQNAPLKERIEELQLEEYLLKAKNIVQQL